MLIFEIFLIIAGICLIGIFRNALKGYHCRDCGYNFGISDGSCPKCGSSRILF